MGFGGGGGKAKTSDFAGSAVTSAKLSYGGASSVIGTRTLRNVNLPWALGGGLTVVSGTVITQGTGRGSVRAEQLKLQSPIRASAGSIGLGSVRAGKLGYGATASAIGTRTLRNVNLPWAMDSTGLAVTAGTLQTLGTATNGTILTSWLKLQSPIRGQNGSVGLGSVRASKLGYGSTASAIGTRTLRNVNLPWALGTGFAVSSGTLQTQGTTTDSGTIRANRLILQSPVRQEAAGGSVGLGSVRASKLGYGATASAIGTRTLRNVNLPWALGSGFAVVSGTLQTLGTGATTSGTIRASLFSLQSPVRREASGGSIGLGTVRAGKLGYGSTASAIGTRTLRNVNLPWALGTGLSVVSGTLQQIGTHTGLRVGTHLAKNIGSYAVNPHHFDIRTWNLNLTHPFWEGWLDRRRTARNTIPGGIGLGSFARMEYGGIGIATISWSYLGPSGAGASVNPLAPGTAYLSFTGGGRSVRGRGVQAWFTMLDYRVPSTSAHDIYFQFGGSCNHNGQGTAFEFLSRQANGSIHFVRRGPGGGVILISGTTTKGAGARIRLAALRTGGGSWVFLKGRSADQGWVVVGKVTATLVPTLVNMAFVAPGAGSFVVHRVLMTGPGWA